MEYYKINVAGIERDLPIVPISDRLSIAAFVIFGDTEIVGPCAEALAAKLPPVDYLITAEAKSIPLIYEMAKVMNMPRYIIARKSVKGYMAHPIVTHVNSITTKDEQILCLDEEDVERIRGRRVAIIDDSRIAEIGKIEDIFASPKSDAARRLVFHDTKSVEHFTGKRCIRIVFDGRSSFEPVVSNMVMECKVPVNIMFADLKDIDGKAAGQLVLQLPDEETGAAKVKNYLAGHGLNVEEVGGYV